MFSIEHPACKVCLHSFEDFPYELTKLDHFKIDDKPNSSAALKKYQLDRNISKIIQQDIKLDCIYSDCEGCSKKSDTYETILLHQQNCRACDDCEYLCTLPNQGDESCGCNEYFTRAALNEHVEAKIGEAQKQKKQKELESQLEALKKAKEEQEQKQAALDAAKRA
jgi:hypothetical protein